MRKMALTLGMIIPAVAQIGRLYIYQRVRDLVISFVNVRPPVESDT